MKLQRCFCIIYNICIWWPVIVYNINDADSLFVCLFLSYISPEAEESLQEDYSDIKRDVLTTKDYMFLTTES